MRDATADANLSPAEVPHPRNTPSPVVVWLRELTIANQRVWKNDMYAKPSPMLVAGNVIQA